MPWKMTRSIPRQLERESASPGFVVTAGLDMLRGSFEPVAESNQDGWSPVGLILGKAYGPVRVHLEAGRS